MEPLKILSLSDIHIKSRILFAIAQISYAHTVASIRAIKELMEASVDKTFAVATIAKHANNLKSDGFIEPQGRGIYILTNKGSDKIQNFVQTVNAFDVA